MYQTNSVHKFHCIKCSTSQRVYVSILRCLKFIGRKTLYENILSQMQQLQKYHWKCRPHTTIQCCIQLSVRKMIAEIKVFSYCANLQNAHQCAVLKLINQCTPRSLQCTPEVGPFIQGIKRLSSALDKDILIQILLGTSELSLDGCTRNTQEERLNVH